MARFSEMLLNRRRQLGMSIQQVANVIKIRPQILEYFENGEFTQMPPRGYAQGMISSYARYLGLNPREVIDAYFDDLYEFEKSARTHAGRYQGAVMETTVRSSGGTRTAPSRLAGTRGVGRPPQAGYVSDYEAVHGSDATRTLPRNSFAPADPTRRGASRAGSARGGQSRGTGARNRGGRGSSRSGAHPGAGRSQAGSRSSRAAGGRGTRRGSASAGFGLDPRLLIIGGVVVLALLVVLVVLAVRGCTAQPENGASSDQPAAAQTDAGGAGSADGESASDKNADADAQTSDEDAGDANAANGSDADSAADGEEGSGASSSDAGGDADADQAAEPTVIGVEVESGVSVWMEITVDGKSVYASQTAGPFSREYEPTESFEIRVDKSDAVTVTENGEELSFDRKSAGVSRISVEVPQPAASGSAGTGEDAGTDSSGTDAGDTDSAA